MSHWICCNSCFMSPGSERQLAVTNCGHVICNVCFQRGKQCVCPICKAKCQISPLSDKSSSEIQALFSDINTVAVKYFSEIIKVLQFQARHHKRLLAHYQHKIEKMKEAGLKMQQEMQQEMQKMSKKIKEQNAYVSKLEMTLKHQSLTVTSQSNRNVHSGRHLSTRASSATKIPYSSTLSLPRTLSTSSIAEGIEINTRGLSYKPPHPISDGISLINSQKDGHIGSVPLRASSQSTVGSHSGPFSATVREFSNGLRDPVISPYHNVAYRRESWETPVFRLPSAYKYPSVSSLGPPS